MVELRVTDKRKETEGCRRCSRRCAKAGKLSGGLYEYDHRSEEMLVMAKEGSFLFVVSENVWVMYCGELMWCVLRPDDIYFRSGEEQRG